ncbi:bifunctional phosphoribosylaminoimidazolecarboxamide formyltransferase/IMP cyclohydrolase [Halofilum ochraceum]|uniref:bifunctional phosphoribosylaminoimidazolecarboxamide formyltransferase/IMP cyclohydrolase n=1 Tax=Halofilum ochraceum TaxID=1611323 RepID=UPI0008D9D2DF|nr:bifunctional phosphoribosylaminoimidazolecarboxamide formyltransferase/IMP cyclohydrolase [Halofilum ochraceum]
MNDSHVTPVRRALLSVSDKTGLEDFARSLADAGVELLSTGGTARALSAAGLAVTEVADHTGFPEIMGGRVKTLHPRIHGGILGRRGEDAEAMAEHGIDPIDLVVVNLYPFRETVARPDVTRADAIENIDIGGPAMVRAAAKNQADVGVVTDPEDYATVAAAVAAGGLDATTRRRLATKAFRHTAAYDGAIAAWLTEQEEDSGNDDALPEQLETGFERVLALRYGENPHQRAAFYAAPNAPANTVTRARVRQGKALSFNNIADADTALECVKQFDEPACVIVKHANPCGVAIGADAASAYEGAYATDPVSAFGGIIAFNQPLDAALAKTLIERQFIEVLLAPSVDEDALRVLSAKPNVRVLETGSLGGMTGGLDYRGVAGGLLVQDRDTLLIADDGLRTATRTGPDAATERDLLFAWRVCKSVKSNAIVYARDGATVGVGAGQMSRVNSARIAIHKAADAGIPTPGSVIASDAFIPFRDVLDVAAGAGVKAVIQPGGSVRDDEVIAAAEELGIIMVFTGMRHFRH